MLSREIRHDSECIKIGDAIVYVKFGTRTKTTLVIDAPRTVVVAMQTINRAEAERLNPVRTEGPR